MIGPANAGAFLMAVSIIRLGRFHIHDAFRDLSERGVGLLFFSESLVEKSSAIQFFPEKFLQKP
jgi:hypothetical protein